MDKEAEIQAVELKIEYVKGIIFDTLNALSEGGAEGLNAYMLSQKMPVIMQHQYELAVAETRLLALKSTP